MSEDSFSRRGGSQFNSISVEAENETIELSSGKFVFWAKEKTLFLADCHFGKVAHFRNSGIGVPKEAGNQTFTNIHRALLDQRPDRVIFLGDLFHSHYNEDIERFRFWRNQFRQIQFELVLGNHDIVETKILESLGLSISLGLGLGPFFCTHHPDFESKNGFNLAGHLHPASHISGLAHQSHRLPCFWKGSRFMVLPAFGSFTGYSTVRPGKADQIFSVAGSKLIETTGLLA